MVLLRYIGITLACLFSIYSAPAQEYLARVQYYSELDGLPHREVNSILQDQKGYIWLATKQGICRFDGYTFLKYPMQKTGASTDNFWYFCEDDGGFFWMVHWSTLFRGDFHLWNPYTGVKSSARQMLKKEARFPDSLELGSRIISGPDKAIYIPTTRPTGFLRYSAQNGFEQFKLEQFERIDLVAATDKYIWSLGDSKTLIKMDRQGAILELKAFPEIMESINPIRGMRTLPFNVSNPADKSGNIVWNDQGLTTLPAVSSTAIPMIIPGQNTGALRLQLDGTTVYDELGKPLLQMSDPDFTNKYQSRSLLADQYGRLWLGTNFGLFTIEFQKNQFKTYFKNNTRNHAEFNPLRGITRLENELFFGFQNKQLWQLDPKNGTVAKWSNSELGFLLAVAPLPDKKLAIGQLGNLVILDLKTNQLKTISGPTNNPQLTTKNIWAMATMSDTELWIAPEGAGIQIVDLETETVEPFRRYNTFTELKRATVYQIERNSKGEIFICSDQGFYTATEKEGITARYWTGGKGAYKIPHNNIFHAHHDGDSLIWLAGGGGGLLRLATGNSEQPCKQFTRAEGLSNDVIYAVYSNDNHSLWLSSDNGIMRFDKDSSAVDTYLEADGISHREFNRIAHFQDEDGTIYFGSLNGVTAFHPQKIAKIKSGIKHPLVITEFEQFDASLNRMDNRTQELLESGEIILQPGDRFFRLEFALLNFMDQKRNLYAYQIDGIDQNWNYQQEHTLRFGRLPYGKHTLRIKAQDSYGRWTEKQLNIIICVLRPFYLEVWFIALIVALLLLLGFLILRRRTANLKHTQEKLKAEVALQTATIRQQAEELRHLDQAKSRFFANVSHELRTPLTLMIGPISTVLGKANLKSDEKNLLETAHRNGQMLQRLINEILDLSKLDAGKMEVRENPIVLHKFLSRAVAQFESHAKRNQIQFIFQNKAGKELCILSDEKKLEKILFNYLSNAFKFTPSGGTVTLSAEDTGTAIRFEVKDTGRGIAPEDLPLVFDRYFQSKRPDAPIEGGTGIGLELCKELAEVMQGKVWVSSQLGTGSCFGLEIQKNEIRIVSDIDRPEEKEPARRVKPVKLATTTNHDGAEKKASLLIVEDNDELRDYLVTLLGNNFEIAAVENGREALVFLEEQKIPDIIISDIMMPVMDGFQLLQQLKNSDHLRSIPIIMLTARADLQDKLHALRIGVDDYLLKPFNEEELLARINNLLTFHRQRPSQISTKKHSRPGLSAADSNWLDELEQQTEKILEDPRFNIAFLAEAMDTNSRQLQRRIKKTTGLTANQYIQEARLQVGRRLLETGGYFVKEVAEKVGFKDPHYFSTLYRERFGKSPAELEG